MRRRVVGEVNEELYSTPEDALATAEALGLGGRGRYILAATFGNVHGVYKPDQTNPAPLEPASPCAAATLGDMLAADGQSA
jgi:fructose-bisphosphate aldolase, class II